MEIKVITQVFKRAKTLFNIKFINNNILILYGNFTY